LDYDQITKVSVDRDPILSCKLGQIKFGPNSTKPLGGLNPYSPLFDTIGKQLFDLVIQYGNYNQRSRILDIGCGTGRLAKQFVGLNNKYTGFEINKYFYDYCIETYKDFEFIYSDVHHEEFNDQGQLDIFKKLPFKDSSYDIITCFALFNHFHIKWILHYIKEISRILKPKGHLISTILLLNEYSVDQIESGKTKQPFIFKHQGEGERYEFEKRKLLNVAVEESILRRQFLSNKLIIKEPIKVGTWCNGQNPLSGHDILIASKL